MAEQAPPPVETVADEDRQHLRLALVMSGGVSLAVWMGGAAHEFHRVMRRDGRVYRGLLELTATRASIDAVVALSWALLLLSMGAIARRNEAVGAPLVRTVEVL